MDGILRLSTGTIPAGNATQNRNESPTPHVSPVPGPIARCRTSSPNSIPQTPPNKGLTGLEPRPSHQSRTPPRLPTTSPSKLAIAPSRDGFIRGCFLLFQIDCLNNIAWEKKLDAPIDQDTDLALKARKFR